MNTWTYLASPYTPIGPHTAEESFRIRQERFEAASKAAALLMRRGEVVFCPIAHSHPIDAYFKKPESGEFWKRQDEPFLTNASKVVVLQLLGWGYSKGVLHEIRVATERGIPIEYITLEQLEAA